MPPDVNRNVPSPRPERVYRMPVVEDESPERARPAQAQDRNGNRGRNQPAARANNNANNNANNDAGEADQIRIPWPLRRLLGAQIARYMRMRIAARRARLMNVATVGSPHVAIRGPRPNEPGPSNPGPSQPGPSQPGPSQPGPSRRY
ncbi:hypothetical protein CAEBREN_03672 [Caenorhabditis brenneri]|uniref:Uncharacterized protein n=1 Tax=Caenorhabditis brenneri TaxID=135651 RepID=G0M7L2_CAEBE|nr:hypothetical protein CAEBREN_03672 [Caenorhabditis brenneri]